MNVVYKYSVYICATQWGNLKRRLAANWRLRVPISKTVKLTVYQTRFEWSHTIQQGIAPRLHIRQSTISHPAKATLNPLLATAEKGEHVSHPNRKLWKTKPPKRLMIYCQRNIVKKPRLFEISALEWTKVASVFPWGARQNTRNVKGTPHKRGTNGT